MNVVYTIKQTVTSAKIPGTNSQAFRFDEDGGGRRIDMRLECSIDLAVPLINEEKGCAYKKKKGKKRAQKKVTRGASKNHLSVQLKPKFRKMVAE
jgi:hypothetical protein